MKSELFPEELQKELSKNHPLYSQDGKGGNTIFYHHFFIGNIDMWISEGNEEGDDFTFFGVTKIHEKEWGYMSLKEMENITVQVPIKNMKNEIIGHFPCKLERDLYFTPTKASEILHK